MNTCSCLNLILACIVYWQAREISRVLSQCEPVANGVDTSLLEHVSPIEWDNVCALQPVYSRSEAGPSAPPIYEGRP
jgi:hypothetical protein